MTKETNKTTLTEFTTESQDNSEQNEEMIDNTVQRNRDSIDSTDKKTKEDTTKDGDSDSETYEDINENIKSDIEFTRELLEDQIDITLTQATVDRYLSHLRQYLRHLYIEDTSLFNAEVSDVRLFFDRCVEINYRKSTLEIAYSAIKKLYRLCRIETDQSTEIDLVELEEINVTKYRTPPAIEREPLTDDEVEKLIEQLEKRCELMTIIGLETGARNIDVTKIIIDRVDLDNQEIELTDTKNNDTYTRPISETLSIELRQWIEVGRLSIQNAEQSKYLFPTRKSEKIGTQHFREMVRSAAEDAGIQEELGEYKFSGKHKKIFGNKIEEKTYYKVTPHALRHTLNVRLQEKGLSIEGRAAALNQSTVDVNKEYSRPNTEYKKVLEELLN